jgi:uncharacterized phage protein gp47/JayE
VTVGVDQLRARITRVGAIDFLLQGLTSLGFTATSWALDSKQYKYVRAFSTVWSDLSEVTRQVAGFALNDFATGTPLTELSRSNFANERNAARKTTGPLKLTNNGGTPYTLLPGQVVAKTATGVEFGSTTGGSLAASGGTLTVTIEAAKAGAAGNVANGAISSLVTGLAGVTCTNEAGPGGLPWYTTTGSDEEGVESLRQRNRLRITTLNQISLPADGYEFLARSVPGIVRVRVDDSNPRGPHTIDVYCATALGPAATVDLDAVQALLDAKRSPSALPLAVPPPVLALNPAGTVHLTSAFDSEAKREEVRQVVRDFCGSFDLGGLILPPSTTGVLPYSELVTAISQVPGVAAVRLTNPVTDLPLTLFQIVTEGDLTGLTFQTV